MQVILSVARDHVPSSVAERGRRRTRPPARTSCGDAGSGVRAGDGKDISAVAAIVGRGWGCRPLARPQEQRLS